MELSIVIPAYNEEKVIVATVDKVYHFLKNNFKSFEIIVVDDKSTDKTLAIIEKLPVKVLRNLKNHGKGYTVAKGVKAAQGEWILFMDADNSTDITEIVNFLKNIYSYQMIIASRALPESNVELGQNFIKVFFGKAGAWLIRTILQIKVRDTQCGYKFFNHSLKFLFEKLTIERWGFDFELLFLAKKYNFKIKEMPVKWVNNFDSKVKWYSYLKTLMQVFKVRINNLLGKYN